MQSEAKTWEISWEIIVNRFVGVFFFLLAKNKQKQTNNSNNKKQENNNNNNHKDRVLFGREIYHFCCLEKKIE